MLSWSCDQQHNKLKKLKRQDTTNAQKRIAKYQNLTQTMVHLNWNNSE